MAYIFTIIFISKLVSNLCKNFLCITWHQKPTVIMSETQARTKPWIYMALGAQAWQQAPILQLAGMF